MAPKPVAAAPATKTAAAPVAAAPVKGAAPTAAPRPAAMQRPAAVPGVAAIKTLDKVLIFTATVASLAAVGGVVWVFLTLKNTIENFSS
jgi:hypothetical protein